MDELDISELFSGKHNLKKYFNKIVIEKHPDQNSRLIHFYWKRSTYAFDIFNCKIEENGACWAICVKVDMSDDFLMSNKEKKERSKPKHELVSIPQGIKKIIVDRIREVGDFILTGRQLDAGYPDKIR